MLYFIYGASIFYALGAMLMLSIYAPTDESRPNAHVWFSLLWPGYALITIFEVIVYGPGEDE